MAVAFFEGVIQSVLEELFEKLLGDQSRKSVLVVIDVGLNGRGAQILLPDKNGIGFGNLIEGLNSRSAPLGNTRFRADLALWSPTRYGDDHEEVAEVDIGRNRVRFPKFKFAKAKSALDEYDAMMLFGVRPGEPGDQKADGEFSHDPDDLNVIHQFMDAGKGLFAVGDHGELGANLCKEIQRVRSMRQWESRQTTDTEGTPVPVHTTDLGSYFDAPPVVGEFRNDTNQWPYSWFFSPNAIVPFGAQGDWRPQLVRTPRWAHHSILTGIEGGGGFVVMPDHPHEGRTNHENIALYMPTWMAANGFIDDVADWDEYPGIQPGEFKGSGPKPELILETVTAKFWRPWPDQTRFGEILHSKDVPRPGEVHKKEPLGFRKFGVLTTYDGLLLLPPYDRVGRVAVDSTWHHWAFENVVGLSDIHYQSVEKYWLNVAGWICGVDVLENTIAHLVIHDRTMPIEHLDLVVERLADQPSELDFELASRVVEAAGSNLGNVYSDVLARIMSYVLEPDQFWFWYHEARDVMVSLNLDGNESEAGADDRRVMRTIGATVLTGDELTEKADRLRTLGVSAYAALGRVVAHNRDAVVNTQLLTDVERQNLISPDYPAKLVTVEITDDSVEALRHEFQKVTTRTET